MRCKLLKLNYEITNKSRNKIVTPFENTRYAVSKCLNKISETPNLGVFRKYVTKINICIKLVSCIVQRSKIYTKLTNHYIKVLLSSLES